MTKTDHHKSVLACVAGGQPHWRLLLLEMFSTCTCYSRLHWRRFGYVSPCYWTTWPSLILARFRFLMDHVSGPCCSTCQFFIGTRVVLWLGHVSFLRGIMCHICIGPRGHFIFDDVLFFDSAMWLDGFLPRVGFLIAMCHALAIHVSCTGWSTCRIFIWSHGMSWFYRMQD